MDPISRKQYPLQLLATALAAFTVLLLNGCTGISVAAPAAIAQAASGTVTMVAQSAPSMTTTVQSLRLQITSAVLNPGKVQLLATPARLDLANITAGSTVITTASAPAGQYSSLAITFANPTLSITNTSGSTMPIPGGTCAVQSTCTFIPVINTSLVNVKTGALPLTVVTGQSNNFALTLAVGKILQSDDTLDFSTGVDTGIDQVGSSGSATSLGNEPLDAQLGVVQSVANGQLVLSSESANISTAITIDNGTTFNFPPSVCSANNSTCIVSGEIVVATLSLTSAGTVHADSLAFADIAGATLLQGTITLIAAASGSFQMLVTQSFDYHSTSSADDTVVTVVPQAGAAFGVASTGFPSVSGTSFTSLNDMVVGQTVLVDVDLASHFPNISTAQILLADSSASGTVSMLGSNMDFILTNYSAEEDNASPITSVVAIQTGTTTLYRNLTPPNFLSLTNGQSVSVSGPLLSTSPTATLAASRVSLHSPSDQ